MVTLQTLLGIELPIIQAPMAGVQDSRLAVAVSNAGGLGSLPCAMLSPSAMRTELAHIVAHTTRPYNVNFFCHRPPSPNAHRETEWRAALAPYYREFELGLAAIPYVDRNPSTRPGDRKLIITLFTMLFMFGATLTIAGSFFRGTGYNWAWPWSQGLFFEL